MKDGEGRMTEVRKAEREREKNRKGEKEKGLFASEFALSYHLRGARARAVGKPSIKISVNKRPALAPTRDSTQRAHGAAAAHGAPSRSDSQIYECRLSR